MPSQRRCSECESIALLLDLNQANTAFLDNTTGILRIPSRFQPGMARTQRWVACKRQLTCRIEYPYPVISSGICRRQKKGGLGIAKPLGEAQHLCIAEAFGFVNHAQGIAGKRSRSKDIHQIELHHCSPENRKLSGAIYASLAQSAQKNLWNVEQF